MGYAESQMMQYYDNLEQQREAIYEEGWNAFLRDDYLAVNSYTKEKLWMKLAWEQDWKDSYKNSLI